MRDHLIHMVSFWSHRKDFADKKGWDEIYAIADKQLRIAKKRLRKFKPKKIDIPIQMIVNVENIRSKIENYNPYTGIQNNTR